MPLVLERTKAVEKFRKKSDRKATNKLSSEPHKFLLEKNYDTALIIPRVSSERRKYIPLVFVDNDSLVNDSCLFISNASLYDFAILTSAMHMAWMRAVSGRLKSDYRYSASVVYNTFPFPYPTEKQKVEIEKLAEEILLIRETYPELTLADMYAPDKMPENLKEAHYKLDYAVDSLYQRKPFENDDERLLLLFSLYEKLTKENPEISAGNDEGSEEE